MHCSLFFYEQFPSPQSAATSDSPEMFTMKVAFHGPHNRSEKDCESYNSDCTKFLLKVYGLAAS